MRIIHSLLLAMAFVPGPYAFAGDLGGGIAAVDEGDDRLRPAAMVHTGFSENFFARAYYYGRDMEVVRETTALLGIGYRFPLYSQNSGLRGALGGVGMMEQTSINVSAGDTGATENYSQTNYNAGMIFGLYWEPLPKPPTYLSIGWESYLFPAGQAAILLVTGRRQMISIASGIRW